MKLKAQDTELSIPVYLEIDPESNDSSVIIQNSPVPCFNWDGSGTCCAFRYNGLPTNPLVNYNWCGANCGGGCYSPPTPVNNLDTCCQTHDCAYFNTPSYPARCTADQNLIDCARNTDNAGSSRVVVAFQAKMTFFKGCY